MLALPDGQTDGRLGDRHNGRHGCQERHIRDKYDRWTRASSGFFTRRELALEIAGPTPAACWSPGCGPGVVSPLLGEQGADTHGADLSAGQLATAAERDPHTLYVQGDLETLAYRDGTFDTVVLLGVFEYVD